MTRTPPALLPLKENNQRSYRNRPSCTTFLSWQEGDPRTVPACICPGTCQTPELGKVWPDVGHFPITDCFLTPQVRAGCPQRTRTQIPRAHTCHRNTGDQAWQLKSLEEGKWGPIRGPAGCSASVAADPSPQLFPREARIVCPFRRSPGHLRSTKGRRGDRAHLVSDDQPHLHLQRVQERVLSPRAVSVQALHAGLGSE